MHKIIKKSEFEQLIHDIHSYDLNYHSREIYIHSTQDTNSNDEEYGVEHRMATSFIKNLHVLDNNNNKNILAHMHTTGGYWTDGMAIFNAIQYCRSPVTILVYAQAFSMSGVILQAADKRVLTPDCEFMVHYGNITVEENQLAAKSKIDMNEKYSKRMLQLFAERAILTSEFFKERNYSLSKTMSYFDRKIKDKGDWYLTVEEAVYYGLADGVLGEKGFETIDKIRIGRKFKGTRRGNTT